MSKIHFSIKPLLTILCILFFFSCTQDKPKEEDTIGNVLRVRLPAEPDKLHPIHTSNSYAIQLWPLIFPLLLDNHPSTLEISPVLAKSLPVIEEINEGPYAGGASYTYEIHEAAVWDNGTPVLASDYLFTIKAIKTPNVNSIYASFFQFISAIEIDSSNPKKFTVYSADRYILAEASAGFMIYPEYEYDPEGIMKNFSISDLDTRKDLADDPQLIKFAEQFNDTRHSRDLTGVSGCGAYKLTEWVSGQKVVLTKKENWWGDQLVDKYDMLSAYPDKIIYSIIPDHASAISLLKNNETDLITNIPAQNFVDLQKNDLVKKQYELHTPPMLAFSYIALNNNSDKLSDKKVRQALAHLLNKDRLIKEISSGFGTPTIGPFHPSKAYYHKGLSPYNYSPEKARALLEAAGWKDSNNNGIVDKEINGELVEMKLTISLVANHTPGNNLALILQNNAKKAGIQIDTRTSEFNKMMENINKGDFEMYFLTAGADPLPDDPTQLWHTKGGTNRVGFGNADTDALIEKIISTLDSDKRNALYKEFQELLHEEQPFLFLWSPSNCMAVNKRFDNAIPTAKRPGLFTNMLKHKK